MLANSDKLKFHLKTLHFEIYIWGAYALFWNMHNEGDSHILQIL